MVTRAGTATEADVCKQLAGAAEVDRWALGQVFRKRVGNDPGEESTEVLSSLAKPCHQTVGPAEQARSSGGRKGSH